MLHIDHPGDQDAGIADDQPARLEISVQPRLCGHALDHRGIGVRRRRRGAVAVIGDAEPAAEIDMADGVAVGAQRLHEFGEQPEGGSIGPRSVIWLPICMSTPVTSMPGSFAARA